MPLRSVMMNALLRRRPRVVVACLVSPRVRTRRGAGRAPDTRPTHCRLWSRFEEFPSPVRITRSHPTQPGAPTSLREPGGCSGREAPAPGSRQPGARGDPHAARDDLAPSAHRASSKPAGTRDRRVTAHVEDRHVRDTWTVASWARIVSRSSSRPTPGAIPGMTAGPARRRPRAPGRRGHQRSPSPRRIARSTRRGVAHREGPKSGGCGSSRSGCSTTRFLPHPCIELRGTKASVGGPPWPHVLDPRSERADPSRHDLDRRSDRRLRADPRHHRLGRPRHAKARRGLPSPAAYDIVVGPAGSGRPGGAGQTSRRSAESWTVRVRPPRTTSAYQCMALGPTRSGRGGFSPISPVQAAGSGSTSAVGSQRDRHDPRRDGGAEPPLEPPTVRSGLKGRCG